MKRQGPRTAIRFLRFQGLAVLGAAAIIVAACNSSSKSSSSAPTTSPGSGVGQTTTGSTAAAPTGSTLKIGLITSATGSALASQDAPTAARTWQSWINSHGGIA